MFYGRGFDRLSDVSLNANASAAAARAASQAQHATHAMRELQHDVDRLKLMNQALWELLRDKVGLTEEQLNRKAEEVDLRDGVADGKMSHQPLKCPQCSRISNSRHFKCLYCGMLFEKPAFG